MVGGVFITTHCDSWDHESALFANRGKKKRRAERLSAEELVKVLATLHGNLIRYLEPETTIAVSQTTLHCSWQVVVFSSFRSFFSRGLQKTGFCYHTKGCKEPFPTISYE